MIHHVEILTTGSNVFLPIELYIDIVLVQQGVQVSDLLEDLLDLSFFFICVLFVVVLQIVNDYLELLD